MERIVQSPVRKEEGSTGISDRGDLMEGIIYKNVARGKERGRVVSEPETDTIAGLAPLSMHLLLHCWGCGYSRFWCAEGALPWPGWLTLYR